MLVALREVEIGYGRPLFPPLTLELGKGERVGILGPNGAGKSTLLRTIIGLLPALSGRVDYPEGHRPRIGYVPQTYRPDPAWPLTTSEAVLMGRFLELGVGRRPRREDREAVRAQLEAVGLADQGEKLLRELSGGQRQRALVARALVGEPELLVLDEPTSEMDPAAEHELLQLVGSLAARAGSCVLFVTHEISAAAAFASKLVLVNQRTGVIHSGPADALLTDANLTRLYGRPVELRREGGHTLVWIAADEEGRR